jgi:hypothetical protein
MSIIKEMSIINYYNKNKTHEDFNMIDCYNISIYNERLINDIHEKLKEHHSLYRFPAKAEYLEDIWDQCINPKGSDWKGGGHQSGADTIHDQSKTRYQNKSGQIINNRVHITSHRLAKQETFEDKLNFISRNHCDKYVLFSRDEKDWDSNNKSYNLMIFDSKLLDFNSLEWSEHIPTRGKNKGTWNGGYIGKGDPLKFEATIDGPGTSNQLKISINIDYIGGLKKLSI